MARSISLAEALIYGIRTGHGFQNFEEWQQRELGKRVMTDWLFGRTQTKILDFLTKGKSEEKGEYKWKIQNG